MKEFFDTSVLIAAYVATHPHNEASSLRLASAQRLHSCCALHSFAEMYASLTAMAPNMRVPPEFALLFLEDVHRRLTTVALDAEEYLSTVRRVAEKKFAVGKVYDALLLACAEKVGVQIIYTWNLNHFRSVAPHLADRIQTP